jgi:hypothetical protein
MFSAQNEVMEYLVKRLMAGAKEAEGRPPTPAPNAVYWWLLFSSSSGGVDEGVGLLLGMGVGNGRFFFRRERALPKANNGKIYCQQGKPQSCKDSSTRYAANQSSGEEGQRGLKVIIPDLLIDGRFLSSTLDGVGAQLLGEAKTPGQATAPCWPEDGARSFTLDDEGAFEHGNYMNPETPHHAHCGTQQPPYRGGGQLDSIRTQTPGLGPHALFFSSRIWVCF